MAVSYHFYLLSDMRLFWNWS